LQSPTEDEGSQRQEDKLMYSNHFVFCVLINGEPQKELGNGTVNIPFGEYSLRFRNKNDRRAVVKIYIDGENVSGEGYIINSKSHVDIKRHHDKDRSFKFVSLDSSDAVDFGKNGPNEDKVKGTIEARFYLEKERPQVIFSNGVHHHIHYNHPRPQPFPHLRHDLGFEEDSLGGIGASNRARARGSSAAPKTNYSCNEIPAITSLEALTDGCTVEGNSTGQNFHTVFIETEDICTSLKLFLQGFNGNENANFVSVPETRKTNQSKFVDDLEMENENLRQKLAEIENQQLKDKLSALEKPKPRVKAKPRSRKNE